MAPLLRGWLGSIQRQRRKQYQAATKQAFLGHPEHAASYFVSIPAGTQSVSLKFSADSWYQGPFIAQDFAIWAKGGTTTPPPVPTATSVPPTQAPTKTPVPPTKTPVPPTQTPVPPTKTPVPPTQPASWTSSATVAKATLARGATQNVSVSVTANKAVNALVDIEIYGPTGTKVWQSYRENIAFKAGVSQTIQETWSVPATSQVGTYTVKIGVFTPGWGQVLSWNNSAASFTVN